MVKIGPVSPVIAALDLIFRGSINAGTQVVIPTTMSRGDLTAFAGVESNPLVR